MLHIGIDVGSTTVKAVVIQPDTNEVIFSRYRRHNACQSELVLTFLKEILSQFPHKQYRIALCGSGARRLPI